MLYNRCTYSPPATLIPFSPKPDISSKAKLHLISYTSKSNPNNTASMQSLKDKATSVVTGDAYDKPAKTADGAMTTQDSDNAHTLKGTSADPNPPPPEKSKLQEKGEQLANKTADKAGQAQDKATSAADKASGEAQKSQ